MPADLVDDDPPGTRFGQLGVGTDAHLTRRMPDARLRGHGRADVERPVGQRRVVACGDQVWHWVQSLHGVAHEPTVEQVVERSEADEKGIVASAVRSAATH